VKSRITIRPAAQTDIEQHAIYIGSESHDAAMRFIDATARLLDELAEFPESGRVRSFNNARLRGLRSRCVPGFRSYLVFYLPTQVGIGVVRVLHAARELDRILNVEE